MQEESEKSSAPEPVPQPERPAKSLWVQYGEYSHLAIAMPAGTFVGWFIGSWVDGKAGTHWIQWVGMFLGIVAGFMDLLNSAKKMTREK